MQELAECLPFELLRSGKDRGDYLVTTHCKIVAMTCTHAALMRDNLVRLGFGYDSLVCEESAQILEVETLIPMLLQKTAGSGMESRLKRVVLIGDHHQLPPVVKNRAFQRYGHLDQSLFLRFIRLNVPHITLNAQGRARPGIAGLYNWRYNGRLKDLARVKDKLEYRLANTGLMYDYQFIDVPDYDGIGESSPLPYFYQNLGEAEWAVGLFMLLRLFGYPGDKISILTTYNGQKILIKDVLAKRCGWNPLYGWPKTISSVDQFQGDQNDFIILSLVRTGNSVGHLRDVRRLVVALSRARFGLIVLGRFNTFDSCTELQPAMEQFRSRPRVLALYKDFKEEFWPCERFLNTDREYARANTHLVLGGLDEVWRLIGDIQTTRAREVSSLA